MRVHGVELAGLDQRGDDRPVGAALVAAGEERVLPVERDRPDAALDRVGVDLDAAVVEEAAKALPVVQAVADRLGGLGAARQLCELLRRATSSGRRRAVSLRACRALRRSSALRPRISASIP